MIRFVPWYAQIPKGTIQDFYIDVREFKLELGNKPTDWTPAPEDLEKKVTTLTDKYNQTVQTVEGNKTTIANVKTSVDEVTGKVTKMESSITEIKQTADGVKTTVTENKDKWDKASSDASSAVSTANKAQTIAKQTASKFQWIVKSGTSATDFTLTDRTAQLVADSINLKGLVTFKGLDSSTQNKITDANNKIDNLQIGGRNLIQMPFIFFSGNKIESGNYSVRFNLDGNNNVDTYVNFKLHESPIQGDVYTFSFKVKGIPENGYFGPWHINNGKKKNYMSDVIDKDGFYSMTFTMPSNENSFTFDDSSRVNLKGDITFYDLKLEKGNKATDWTPAPEDKADQSIIDNWAKDSVINGETVINGGYIKTNTIKTDQLAVEEIFATGSAVMNIVNAQEINANRITSGLLSAERIDAYGLSIVNKNTNQQTFNISNTGEVTIRGSVSSSNYRSKKSGWAINNDGTAEFNNITARGSVITTDGGIASSGGTGRNLARDTSDKYSAWFKPRNGAYGETMKFGRIIPVFQDADNKFVVSFDLEYTQFTKTNDKFVLQLFMLDKNDSANQMMNLKGSVADKTLTLNSITNTIYENTVFVQHDTNKVKVLDLTTDSQAGSKEKHYSVLVQLSRNVIEYELVACCNYSNGNGQVRIKQLKVEAGDFETDWSLAPEDKTKQVRFWAGATYDDRESAPFIVYNDGSIRATQGEYSGLWTGDIRIGNISIVDPSSQAGNDAILTIRNGDNGVRKVQLTDGTSSTFAQDIIVANNTYSSMITLKQDGSAYFSKGLNIADKVTLNSSGLILDNKTLTTTSDGSGFLFNNDLHIGSAKSSAHLTVHGDVSADNVKIDNTLYFGNIIKFTKNTNGINIDFI